MRKSLAKQTMGGPHLLPVELLVGSLVLKR